MSKFFKILLTLFASATFTQNHAQAQFFLHDESTLFVDAAIKTRTIGIEVEFSGVDDQKILELVQKHFGGSITDSNIANGVKNVETSLGVIRLKVEGDAWRFEKSGQEEKRQEQLAEDYKKAPREIVFPPLFYKDMAKIQALLDDLKAAGAIGTTPTQAVSLQTNILMGELAVSQKNVDDLLNLMRVYHAPQHVQQLKQSKKILNVPKNRAEFVNNYSKGFQKLLLDPNYRPTARELFDDYMYRQSLELLGHKDAWQMPLAEAHAKLVSYGREAIVGNVVKMVKLRVSSLLLGAFKDDELSKIIIASDWARPAPIVEFREFNNDFDVMGPVNKSLGVIRASQLFGNYDHDELISQITGIAKKDLERLRIGYDEGKIVRYTMQDPEFSPLNAEDRAWLMSKSPNTTLIQLPSDKIGLLPLVMPKGSIVWHRRNIHRATILGEYTPGLENDFMQQVMENKVFEAKIFDHYIPGAMPEMISINDLTEGKKLTPQKIWQKLNQKYPAGWVLKGAFDWASESSILTDKIDIDVAMAKYRKGFKEHKAKIEKKLKGQDPEYIISKLKKHPGYLGWKIIQILKNQNMAFVQKRVKIITEIRVEVLGGRVLGNGSSIDRYKYLYDWYGTGKPSEVTPKQIRAAERYVQNIIDRLPPELAVMPYAFDVALMPDGNWIVIESNAGGNSGFLEENTRSSKMLIEYLEDYPERRKALKGLLTAEQQMSWIKKHFQLFHMQNTELYYPGIHFDADKIVDSEFETIKPKDDEFSEGCKKLLRQ